MASDAPPPRHRRGDFGREHADVAIRLCNRAHLFRDTNRLVEADPLRKQAPAAILADLN